MPATGGTISHDPWELIVEGRIKSREQVDFVPNPEDTGDVHSGVVQDLFIDLNVARVCRQPWTRSVKITGLVFTGPEQDAAFAPGKKVRITLDVIDEWEGEDE